MITFCTSRTFTRIAGAAALFIAATIPSVFGQTPAKPALMTPTDKEQNVHIVPSVRWHPAASATAYNLLLATSVDFITDSIKINKDFTDTTALIDSTVFKFRKAATYYWKVAGRNGTAIGEYSDTWSFTITSSNPPSQPRLSLPADNDSLVSKDSVYLEWTRPSGSTAVKYTLQLSNNSTFTTANGGKIYNYDSLDNTSHILKGALQTDSTYYWRVRAFSVGGFGTWSSVRMFKTGGVQPPKVTLTEPVNLATSIQVPTILKWAAAGRATQYHLQLSTDSIFATILLDTTITAAATPTLTLSSRRIGYATTYFWRVAGRNKIGEGPMSDMWRFKTALAQPVLSLPARNAVNVAQSMRFTWRKTISATTYRLQVSTASDFSSLIVNRASIADSTDTCSQLTASTKYYWRIRAYNAATDSSAFSDAWSFTTVIALPQVVTMKSPANNAENIALRPQLVWYKPAGADNYKIEVSHVDNFSVLDVIDTVRDTTFTPARNLAGLQKYFWRVTAGNTAGWGPVSPVWAFTTIIGAPTMPVLLTPANNEDSVRLPVHFVWKKSLNAVSYRMQVTVQNGPTVLDSIKIGDTTLTLNGLSNDQTYYWRLKAYNVADSSDWCDFQPFKTIFGPPPAPELLIPANGTTNIPQKTTLVWRKVKLANFYSLQVATDTLFPATSLFIAKDTINDTTIAIENLAAGVKYFWRVRSRNAINDQGIWSVARSFVTTAQPQPVPVLVSPTNGSIHQSLNLILMWNPAISAQTYTVQVSKAADFSTLVVNQAGITATSYQAGTPALENSTLYYWRVNATTPTSTTPWSTVWSFKTIVAKPTAPQLLSPADSAVNQPVTVALTWSAVPAADSFSIQVATTPTFEATSIVISKTGLTTTSSVANNLASLTKYHWRVCAINAGGTSDWSAVRSFTTAVAAPGKPVLLLPANASVNQPVALTLSWNAVVQSITYNLQIATAPDFSAASIVVDRPGLLVTSVAAPTLSYQRMYYWRVNAANAGGVSGWSDIWTFTTINGIPDVPLLISPIDSAKNQSVSPILIWAPSVNATSYRVQVSLTAAFDSLSLIHNAVVTNGNSFTVAGLKNNITYFWRVNAINASGTSTWSAVRCFTVIVTAIDKKTASKIPFTFGATPTVVDYGSTSIDFVCNVNERVFSELTVYDALGTPLYTKKQIIEPAAARKSIKIDRWNLRSSYNKLVAAGVYCAILKVTSSTTGATGTAKILIGVKQEE
ncbi:MAG: hypothetical protein JW795_17870 [Chitinivibrionales bacterium]|nr:hypothetical protein [Chitinivibrionales bacterium]